MRTTYLIPIPARVFRTVTNKVNELAKLGCRTNAFPSSLFSKSRSKEWSLLNFASNRVYISTNCIFTRLLKAISAIKDQIAKFDCTIFLGPNRRSIDTDRFGGIRFIFKLRCQFAELSCTVFQHRLSICRSLSDVGFFQNFVSNFGFPRQLLATLLNLLLKSIPTCRSLSSGFFRFCFDSELLFFSLNFSLLKISPLSRANLFSFKICCLKTSNFFLL